MRLGHIEDDARRAAAGIERDLQVLDIVVEGRGVERDAVLRIFDPSLIVPQRFVLVGRSRERAVDGLIGSAAERNVQRIVDAAETEALGDLDVDAEVAVRLPAERSARAEAVRLRLVADAPCRRSRRCRPR